MTKDEALRLALEALELANYKVADYCNGYTIEEVDEAITAIKAALEAKDEPVKIVQYNCTCGRTMKFESEHGVVAPQRTWVGLTPACPNGLTQYECELEGVDLVCFLEYTPDEEGSRDSYGLLNEPGTSENLELVNAYVRGTDVDIGHLLLQYLVDHITTTALEDFKNDDY
jgi:hypothetical protein